MHGSFLFPQLLRELRGLFARLVYFVLCLAVGVAAVVVVAGLSRSLDAGLRTEAKDLLAADLAIEGNRPPPDRAVAYVDRIEGSRRAMVGELATVVAAPGGDAGPSSSLLVELKVIEGPYPLYGELELDPALPLTALLGETGAVTAPEVLSRLGLEAGDTLVVGGQPFTVTGTVLAEPDRIGQAFVLGPRVFLGKAGLERTPLLATGSRVEHRLLVELPELSIEDLRQHAAALSQIAPRAEGFRVETYENAQPALRRGLRRMERYLGLVALLSLLVGGIGVGQAVRSWISSRIDAIAVLKCLGVRPREVMRLYVVQAACLGLAGSLLGCLLGIAALALAPLLLAELLPRGMIHWWQPAALLRGLVLGVATSLVFALLPLTQVLRVPPARVLRQDAEPLPGSKILTLCCGLLLILGTGALAGTQAGSVTLGARFTASLAATAIGLAVAAWVLTWSVRRFRRDAGGVRWRHGLASLARPGVGTLGSVVAIGLGVLVVFAIDQVRSQLRAAIESEVPDEAPSAFFVDVQQDQWSGLESLLAREGATAIESVPVITARLRSIDGRPVAEILEASGGSGRRWALTREQRLTYLPELPESNEVVKSAVPGVLWSDPDRPEVSVEEEFAADLGVDLGSALRLDVQGVPIDVTVTSLRSVEWESFAINFFLVVEPSALEGAPQSRLATARLPPAREQQVQDLVVASFPNVTVVLMRQILERVVALLRRLGWAISLLGGFTLAAGLVILAATVAVESGRRSREVALLKTLGMRRADVVALYATEYGLLGAVAGIIGVLGGSAVAWIAMRRAMELPWRPDLVAASMAVAVSVGLTVLAGVAGSLGALRSRPAEVLRND